MSELKDIQDSIYSVFYKPNGSLSVIGMITAGIIVFIIAHLIVNWSGRLVKMYIERREVKSPKKGNNARRVKTLTDILGNLAKYGVYVIALMLFLDICNVNTSTILATAGVGSIAIAMGAQVMIRDLINGFFIIFDDQYSIGDYVEFAEKSGYVETLGIRTTVIRDFDGSRHIIPNSEIRIVTNRGRGQKRAKVVVPIDRREDPDRVLKVIDEGTKMIKAIYPDSRTDVWGITSFVPEGYEVTAVAWDEASHQFDLEYDLRRCLIKVLNANDIKMPINRYEHYEGKRGGENPCA